MAHKKAILPTISKACSIIDLRCGGLTPGEKGNKSAKMLFFSVEGEYLWVTRKHRSLNPLVALPNPSHT